MKTIKRAKARLLALAVGVASAAVLPAHAADQEDVAELQRVQVTGSRITRMDVEGPQPVVTITAEDLRATGYGSLSDVLRDSTFNSFGSFQGGSGFGGGAQGASQVNLRGIGAQYTLVLVNGRRLSNSPAFSADQQNVNNIPVAAIERVEILRDGASAIYGSDAIGGVINVILKKDYEGMVVGGQSSRPEAEGGDDDLFYMNLGITGNRGSLLFSYENYVRDIILAGSRPGLLGPADLSTPEGVSEAALLGLISPTGFPGRYRRLDADGNLFPVGDPRRAWEAGPGCPESFGEDSNFPRSGIVDAADFGLGEGTVCGYDFAAIAGFTAAMNRDNIAVVGDYEINNDVSAFVRAVYARTKSFGRFAPTPSTLAIVVPGDAEYNPTLGEVGPGMGYDLAVNIRFDPLGPRDSYVHDYMQDIQGGLIGNVDWFGGAEWEIAVGNSRNKQDGYGYNYVIQPLLQRAVDEGLNPFDYDAVAESAATFATTITNDNYYRDRFADARLGWDIADIGGRPVGFVIGAEYHDISYASITDQQSQTGGVVGSSGATSGGSRTWGAGYFETLLPLTDTVEVNIAGRYDRFSDFGSEFSPKLSIGWRPTDTLLVRANFGEGFKAPNMDQLYSAPSQSFNPGRDRRECAALGIDPFSADCANVQRETFLPSNTELEAETATQWTFGGVWNPVDDFSIALDYYSIEIENQIRRLTTQDVLDAEYRCVVEGIESFCDTDFWGEVDRSNLGGIIVTRPLANTAAIKTSGIDMDMAYLFNTGIGSLETNLSISHIFEFETEAVPGSGLVDNIGYRGFPQLRANLTLTWTNGPFNATVIGNYTDGWKDCPQRVAAADPESPECEGDPRISSFTTWNAQLGYEAPWDGRFSIGVRNAFDRQAELQNDGNIDATHTIGIYGRTLYAAYEQRF